MDDRFFDGDGAGDLACLRASFSSSSSSDEESCESRATVPSVGRDPTAAGASLSSSLSSESESEDADESQAAEPEVEEGRWDDADADPLLDEAEREDDPDMLEDFFPRRSFTGTITVVGDEDPVPVLELLDEN